MGHHGDGASPHRGGSREKHVTGSLADCHRLARQRGVVRLQPLGLYHPRVGGHHIAGVHQEQVTGHDVSGVNKPVLSVAADSRMRSAEVA